MLAFETALKSVWRSKYVSRVMLEWVTQLFLSVGCMPHRTIKPRKMSFSDVIVCIWWKREASSLNFLPMPAHCVVYIWHWCALTVELFSWTPFDALMENDNLWKMIISSRLSLWLLVAWRRATVITKSAQKSSVTAVFHVLWAGGRVSPRS